MTHSQQTTNISESTRKRATHTHAQNAEEDAARIMGTTSRIEGGKGVVVELEIVIEVSRTHVRKQSRPSRAQELRTEKLPLLPTLKAFDSNTNRVERERERQSALTLAWDAQLSNMHEATRSEIIMSKPCNPSEEREI